MPKNKPSVYAVVPAAGVGARMAANVPKQYLKLGEQTILEHSVSALLSLDVVAKVVVSIAAADDTWHTLPLSNNPRVVTVTGGATRAQSVLNGLDHLLNLAHGDDWVMVHDAARPRLSANSIDSLIDQVIDKNAGGILALPCNDTVKKVGADQEIESTLDRSQIWLAQTPQMFRLRQLRNAIDGALDSDQSITDEASAMEWAGHSVQLVLGDENNFKVTTTRDFQMMEFLFKSGSKPSGGESDS